MLLDRVLGSLPVLLAGHKVCSKLDSCLLGLRRLAKINTSLFNTRNKEVR